MSGRPSTEAGKSWRLRKQLYGGRKKAPRAFQEHLSGLLQKRGFQACPASPSLYRNADEDMVLTVWVDDGKGTEPKEYCEWAFAGASKGACCLKYTADLGVGSRYKQLQGGVLACVRRHAGDPTVM